MKNQPGAGLAALRNYFKSQKNKMAAVNKENSIFTHIFAYIVLRATFFVSKSGFLGSKNLFMMWYNV